MEFSADTGRPTRRTTSDLAAALRVLEPVAHHKMTDTGTKSRSFETALLGTAKVTETDLASSFMERALAASTVQEAEDKTTESALGIGPKDVKRKAEPSAKSVVQPPITVTKSEVERILGDLSVRTEAGIEHIVEKLWTVWKD